MCAVSVRSLNTAAEWVQAQARKRRLLDTSSPAAPRSCTSGASPSPSSAGPASAFRVVFNGGAQCGGRPRPPSWQQRWAAVAGERRWPLLPAVRMERVRCGALCMCLHGNHYRRPTLTSAQYLDNTKVHAGTHSARSVTSPWQASSAGTVRAVHGVSAARALAPTGPAAAGAAALSGPTPAARGARRVGGAPRVGRAPRVSGAHAAADRQPAISARPAARQRRARWQATAVAWLPQGPARAVRGCCGRPHPMTCLLCEACLFTRLQLPAQLRAQRSPAAPHMLRSPLPAWPAAQA